MSDNMRTYSESAGSLLEWPSNVLSAMLSPTEFDLELGAGESVCGNCHLVRRATADACFNCEV